MSRYSLGLIGYPLRHSLSPKLHHAALQELQFEGEYHLYPIPTSKGRQLKQILERVRTGEIHGLNVTIPHKQTVIPFLDKLTAITQSIGAVNTIYYRDEKLTGDNTDAPGFLADLAQFFKRVQFSAFSKKALILGAGGSARAVVYALLQDGWHITISARRIEQAQTLAKTFPQYPISITQYPVTNYQLPVALIVNATPLGMTPNIHTSPWPAELPFPENAAVYDLVYNPSETRLVQDARAAGLPATTGLGMLIEQAALAFEIWTGIEADRGAMLNSLSL